MRKKKKSIWILAVTIILMSVLLKGCGSKAAEPTKAPQPTPSPIVTPVPEHEASALPIPESAPETITVPQEVEQTEAEEITDTKEDEATQEIRPEFRKTMEDYEAFFDEYILITQAYMKNPGDMNVLLKYTSFLGQYSEMMDSLEKLDTGELNNAETAYYLETMARIEGKLLKALG